MASDPTSNCDCKPGDNSALFKCLQKKLKGIEKVSFVDNSTSLSDHELLQRRPDENFITYAYRMCIVRHALDEFARSHSHPLIDSLLRQLAEVNSLT